MISFLLSGFLGDFILLSIKTYIQLSLQLQNMLLDLIKHFIKSMMECHTDNLGSS